MRRVTDAAFTLRSPSKINLHLRVGTADSSGYHPLRSWMITTSLCDELTFAESRHRRLTCDDPTLACDGSNLVWRAADALLEDGGNFSDVAVHIKKRVPAGAGLGGGSGNAATALVGINRLLKLGRTREELAALAATLGSDVPFFLGPPSAIATGRGEILQPTPAPLYARFAVLIFPAFQISTVAAYQMLDKIRPAADPDILRPFDAADWADGTAFEIHAELANDLEQAAFAMEPRLDGLQGWLRYEMFRPIAMSGSGSTLFALCDTAEDAKATASRSEAVADVHSDEFGPIRTICVELGNPSGFFD